MKKIVLLICMFVLLSPSQAFSADALYRMLNAEEVESFKKDQDAIVVAKLLDENSDGFTVQILSVISGKVNSDKIFLMKPLQYGWSGIKPQSNDYCVISLKKVGRKYKRAWGIFKADSGDYATLNLVNQINKSEGLGDLACIEWYVNSDGIEKDFSFKDGSAFVRRPDGEVIQIYPKQKEISKIAFDKKITNEEEFNSVTVESIFHNLRFGEGNMLAIYTILHFFGASLLVGGEPLVALIAIRAEKDDQALRFFVSFLGTIAKFMWVGMILALVGGIGMFLQMEYSINTLFAIKLVLYVLVAVVSWLLLVNIPKVQAAATKDFSGLRENPIFKKLDLLSKIDMILILAIFIVSVIMY